MGFFNFSFSRFFPYPVLNHSESYIHTCMMIVRQAEGASPMRRTSHLTGKRGPMGPFIIVG